jgi:4'-phosphopantetheinyl transferase
MLEPNVVSVWRIALDSDWDGDEERAARSRRLLSQEELCKADAFRTERLRCHYVMAHGALRVVLGACLGMKPEAVALTVRGPSEGGEVGTSPSKPALAESMRGGATGDLRFNLSHTSGAALIAVTLGREVGVDIERIRPLEDLEAIGQSIFSMEEGSSWEALGEDDRLAAFYRVWTRKEAYLKAIGLGLFRNLQDVTVPAGVGALGGAEDSRRVRDAAGEREWWVTDVPVAEEYCGAVCWEGEGVTRVAVADLSSDLDLNLSMRVDE